MKKQVVSACLVGSMLMSTMAVPAMAVSVDSFSDVNKNDWFYPGVQYVAEKDYMIGVGGDRFAPAMEMTRSMFVTILYRIEGVKDTSQKSQFKDVPDGTWYTQAVNWAAANGIVEGNGADMFLPDNLITRQDMCTMMSRYITYHEKKNNVTHEKKGEAKTFADEAQISDYAVEAVKNCVSWGLIEGNELGYFLPLNTASRAEVATVISRLTWTANESGGSTGGGGGGGTGGDETKTASYDVQAALKLADGNELYLTMNYNNVTVNGSTVTGDKTFGKVVTDLVMSTENANALDNAINQVLNKVKGKTITQTINGQQVTISVSDTGVVSASVSVKVTDFTGDKTRASQEELEALINKLQNGGEMSFSQEDLPVMEDLLTKIEEVQKMDPQEIQDKIDQVVAEKPELAQVVSGMTPDAILEAAGSYKEELTQIKDEVQQAVDSGVTGPIVIEKEPVLMNVAMDLGAYYDQAVEKFEDEDIKSSAINRMESELGLTFNDNQKTKAEAVYDLNDPAKYVTDNNDGTLTLQTSGTYLTMIQENVKAVDAFYASLGQDEEFYKNLLERVENKYQEGYGVTYSEGFVDGMADLLGDKDGILVDGTSFRKDMNFSVQVEVTQDNYTLWRDLLVGKFSQADVLPDVMPDALEGLLGTYTVTFNIDKK